MGFWSIVLPLATTNLVTNPSAELAATTGYSAMAGSIASSSAQQYYGVYSIAVTPTSASDDGVYYGTVSLTSGTTYTASCYVKGVAAVPMRIYFANTSAVLQGSATTFTATGSWERQEVTWACNSTTTFRVYVSKISSNSTGVFYIDGLQVEAQSTATTYCDGDQEGCGWNGTAHAATSTRSAQTRAGGQIVDLTSYGFYVIESPGIGMPALAHHVQDYAMLPGSYYQGSRALPKTFDLVADLVASTRADLHSKRKSLVSAMRPDSTGTQQPFRLIYSGTGVDVETWVVYDNGLSFAGPDGFTERIAVRLIGYDPFWYSGEGGAVLDSNDTATVRYFAARLASSGQWYNTGLSANPASGGAVYAVAVSPTTGKVYIGGDFTHWGNVAGRDYMACYDPFTDTWSDVGADDDFNGIVYALAFHPNGELWIGGAFTDVGATTSDRIAKYTESTNTVTTLVAGPAGNAVRAIAIDSTGNAYFGGDFTDWGDANGDRLVKYNGTAVSSLGTGINDGIVYALACDPDDNLYIGGSFGSAGGDGDINFIAKWTGAAYVDIGEPQSEVYALASDAQGNIYAGGDFTDINSDAALKKIAKYNGASWVSMEGGADNDVAGIFVDKNSGFVYAAGSFSTMGSLTWAANGAIWNGSTWVPHDINSASGFGYAVATSNSINGTNVYMTINASDAAQYSGDTTVTNSGTAEAFPIIKISRTGGTSAIVKNLSNETTDTVIWLYYSLAIGETITLDFRPGRRVAKSSSGNNIWYAVLRGSEFADFSLLPGSNLITCFVDVSGSPTITATMYWPVTHWGADGSAV